MSRQRGSSANRRSISIPGPPRAALGAVTDAVVAALAFGIEIFVPADKAGWWPGAGREPR